MKFILADKNGKLAEVPIEDVLIITLTSKGPLFRTSEGEYGYARTMAELLPALQAQGFESLDRNNIVNTGRISGYDSEYRQVILEAEDGAQIRASVSAARVDKLPGHLRESTAPYVASGGLRYCIRFHFGLECLP